MKIIHVHVNARICANTAYREEILDGVTYYVFPVTMLAVGVHNGYLYTEEELANYPQAWNGVPIPVTHPEVAGLSVSANQPEIQEEYNVGTIYNTKYEDGKLKAEAWINVDKINKVSPKTLQALIDGAPMEVSTGLWAEHEESPGTWNGEEYLGIIHNIRPDHLALLPGQVGACSWKDGCGIRANKDEKGGEMNEVSKWGVKDILRNILGARSIQVDDLLNNATSDRDVRDMLYKALEDKNVKGNVYIYDVFSDDGYFVYEVGKQTADGSWETKIYKRNFQKDESSVTLSDEVQEVRQKVEYVPVENKEEEDGGKGITIDANALAQNVLDIVLKDARIPNLLREEKEDMETICCDRLNALIASGHFNESQKGFLSTLSPEQADKLEVTVGLKWNTEQKKMEGQKKEDKKPGPNVQSDIDVKKLSLDEILANASDDVRKTLGEAIGIRDQKKNALVDALLKIRNDAFTKDELTAKSLEELEKIASLVSKTNSSFALKAGGVVPNQDQPKDKEGNPIKTNAQGQRVGVPECPVLFGNEEKK